MIKPSRVGHATFETPDLDKALAYYTEVNGLVLNTRDKNRAYLASKTGLLTLALEQGREEGLRRISFEVSPKADVADMARKLAADGIKSEVRSDPVPGIGKVLAFDDPKGTTIELFQEWRYLGAHHQVSAPDRSSSGTSPMWWRTRRRWRISIAACWASGCPTGSRISSSSCAATPTTTR